MTEEETLLQFPCRFPLKVMGDGTTQFRQAVEDCVARHQSDADTVEWVFRPSRSGTYLGITVTFTAHSREQLDALYRALGQCPGVRMIL